MRALVLLCLSLLLPLAARAADPTLDAVWIRGTVPAQRSTGAFFVITSPVDAKLVGASTPAAEQAELHEMKHVGDTMQMRQISAIPLPAGKPVALSSGGIHLMLMGLRQPLKVGTRVPLTLEIEVAGKRRRLEAQALVMPVSATRYDEHAAHQ